MPFIKRSDKCTAFTCFLIFSGVRNGTDHPVFAGYYKSIGVGPLVIWTFLHCFIAVSIIFANTLVIASFVKNANLRTRTNCLITSLALADFLVGLVSVPGWLVLVHRELDQHLAWYSVVMEAWYVFEILGGVGSIFHLLALSCDRLCAIVWPLRHRSYTRKKYLVIIYLTWSAATLVSGLSVPGNRISPQAYNMSVICLCFFIPLIMIFVAQGITLYTIKRKTAKFHRNSTLRRDVRAAKTIAIMIGLFLIGWLPFFSLGLAQYVRGEDLTVLPAQAVFAVKLLQYGNSLFNPILYGQKFPEFRKAYIKLLCSAKTYGDTTRFASSPFSRRKAFRTTLITFQTSSSPLSRSPRLSSASNGQSDQRQHEPQKGATSVCIVSGL